MPKIAIYNIIACHLMCYEFVRAVGNSSNVHIPYDLSMENSTSCEEFLANTNLDKSKLIDIDWKVFYFWNPEKETTYTIRFRIPSRLLTDRFKVELQDDLKPPVNWTEAELFMETTIDFSALFIKTQMPGLFRLIPSFAFELKEIPNSLFAIKYVEPGYMGILNCKYRLCYALAPVNRMPKPEDLNTEASKLGFKSAYGYSYLTKAYPPRSLMPYTQDDDDNDDEQLDIEEHGFHENFHDEVDEDDL